jgi:glutathione S-transferase
MSGPTYKVGLMLSLCGLKFDYDHVNLRTLAHKQPPHLARNRFGQVPALTDASNGRCLCQSAVILEYLADVTGKFGGANRDERLHAREWMFWDFDRFAGPIYRARVQRLGLRNYNQPIMEMYHTEGAMGLKVLDDHLKGRNWLVGEGPTIADIDAYGVVAYAPVAGHNLADYPAVSAWVKRFEGLPGFGQPEAILPKESRTA